MPILRTKKPQKLHGFCWLKNDWPDPRLDLLCAAPWLDGRPLNPESPGFVGVKWPPPPFCLGAKSQVFRVFFLAFLWFAIHNSVHHSLTSLERNTGFSFLEFAQEGFPNFWL